MLVSQSINMGKKVIITPERGSGRAGGAHVPSSVSCLCHVNKYLPLGEKCTPWILVRVMVLTKLPSAALVMEMPSLPATASRRPSGEYWQASESAEENVPAVSSAASWEEDAK